MPGLSKERTVQHLQALYTVVVGLALAAAVKSLIDQSQPMPIRWTVLPYFFAYLVTLVPFYHGALCHLDITYGGDAKNAPKSGALLTDWGLLFIESCVLLALALLMQTPETFMYTLAGLLVFDTVWAFIAHLAFSPPDREYRAERKWAIINLATSVVLIFAAVALHAVDDSKKPVDVYRWIVVLTITLTRTICDYAWCWSYYYPPAEGQPAA